MAKDIDVKKVGKKGELEIWRIKNFKLEEVPKKEYGMFHSNDTYIVLNVQCRRESLNLGDVFILDLGRDIYVWMPKKSGRLERIKVT
ncbi:hypothetical protein COOONC_03146 [Cooperia oncophora]